MTKDIKMKKQTTKTYDIKKYFPENSESIVNEGTSLYESRPAKASYKPIITKDFTYKNFKLIADKAPFTLNDWAEIMHISERTLHRYAKENTPFNGLQIEIILLAEKLIDMGNQVFGRDGFKSWMQSSVFSLDNRSPKEFINSYAGLQEIINVIGRIQYGIPS
jgi:putative toxin-antitoxin system antitoxin component (TIGR02293 family)